MARTESKHLNHEKHLPQSIKPHNVMLCPSMDLVAVASSEQQVEVFRLNGQRAFIHRRVSSSTTIVRLCWELDGQHILVAWSDGMIESVRAQDGRNVSKSYGNRLGLLRSEGPRAKSSHTIEALHHGLSVIEPKRVKDKSPFSAKFSSRVSVERSMDRLINSWDKVENDHPSSLDGLLSMDSAAVDDNTADLPRKLSLMDVEDQLPQLPPLPPVEDHSIPILTDPDMFSSQEKMFTQKNTIQNESNLVSLRLSGCADGQLNVRGQNDFYFGDFNIHLPPHLTSPLLRSSNSYQNQQRTVSIASHPFSFMSCILCEIPYSGTGDDENVGLALASIDLKGIERSRHFLPLVQNKVTTLRNCITYIAHAVASLRITWITSQDLPSRFIDNISETLVDENRHDIVTSMYQLAVTGDCSPTIKDWLTTQLSERNQKRWDQAVTHGYSRVLEIIHESLLPALDRCSVVLSRLRVLSKTPDIPVFSIETTMLSETIEILDNIRLLGHTIIQQANKELRQFRVFIGWLLHQIQLQSATPGSTVAEEAADKAAAMDHAQLLHYIVGAMTKSRLNLLLGGKSPHVAESFNNTKTIPKRETLVEMVKFHSKDCMVPDSESFLTTYGNRSDHVNLLYQTLCLSSAFTKIFDTISHNFREAHEVCYGPLLESEYLSGSCDIRMVSETSQGKEILSTYVLAAPKSHRSTVNIHRVTWQVDQHHETDHHNVTRYSSHQSATMAFPSNQHITDAKFLDDDLLAIMVTNLKDSSTAVVQLPYSLRAATCPAEHTMPAFEGATSLAPNWSRIPHIPPPPSVPNWSSSPQKSSRSTGSSRPVVSVPDIASDSPLRLASFDHARAKDRGEFVPGGLQIRRRGEGWIAVVLSDDGKRYVVLTGD